MLAIAWKRHRVPFEWRLRKSWQQPGTAVPDSKLAANEGIVQVLLRFHYAIIQLPDIEFQSFDVLRRIHYRMAHAIEQIATIRPNIRQKFLVKPVLVGAVDANAF